jgi:hypothetical protein
VADIVRDCTDTNGTPSGGEKEPWLLRMHQQLNHRLSGSRSVERIGEAVSEVLASESYRRLVPDGLAPAVWAAGYAERMAAGDA